MTTENSRADALTDEHIKAVWDRECGSYTVWEEWDIPGFVRACIAASPVEQPAVAPMPPNAQLRRVMDLLDAHLGDSDPTLEGMTQEEIEEEFPVVAAMQIIVGLYQDPPTASDTAPSPADERAALSDQDIYDKFSFLEGLVNESTYVRIADTAIEIARAASASETGADVPRLAFDWQTGFVNEHGYPPDSEDGFAAGYMAALSRSPAMAVEAVAIPAGWMLVPKHRGTKPLAELIIAASLACVENRLMEDDDRHELAQFADQLQRSPRQSPTTNERSWTRKEIDGLLDDADRLSMHPGKVAGTIFDCARVIREFIAAPQPAQADARVGLTTDMRVAIQECIDYLKPAAKDFADLDMGDSKHARCIRTLRALLATPQPEPRAEVTNPFRDLLAALIDIYDDERNNAPEDRCYVEGAWSEVLGEARALLTPLPDPAQVAAESPDWIKNALPPEGA
ncbi:hypothetical protein L0U95_24060 (plasmid) [Burkholderia cenocepacia]|uniref:hypothetical protein n=1 Tax=Burkholderia cenocepacia TaxID=95486 RepID=UPI001F1DE637|nr:hypothetical protein [Burkholderia cenocepacia]UJH75015.1 hypothetical protein L0U95_24060 [Burkholderia cenocepacia]